MEYFEIEIEKLKNQIRVLNSVNVREMSNEDIEILKDIREGIEDNIYKLNYENY